MFFWRKRSTADPWRGSNIVIRCDQMVFLFNNWVWVTIHPRNGQLTSQQLERHAVHRPWVDLSILDAAAIAPSPKVGKNASKMFKDMDGLNAIFLIYSNSRIGLFVHLSWNCSCILQLFARKIVNPLINEEAILGKFTWEQLFRHNRGHF